MLDLEEVFCQQLKLMIYQVEANENAICLLYINLTVDKNTHYMTIFRQLPMEVALHVLPVFVLSF